MIDIALLATSAVTALIPYLKKGMESVSEEAGKGLWSWISEKFKGQNKQSDLEALKAKPDDARIQGKIESTLETILIQNEVLANELTKLVEAAKSSGNYIANSKNVVTGNISSVGKVIIGDNNSGN